jgi:hypothetical protein
MCKLSLITSTAKMTPAELSAVITRTHKTLTRTQRDGWGYSIGGYLEKWDEPQGWQSPNGVQGLLSSLQGAAVDLDAVSVGEYPAPGAPLVAHARTATCARGAVNAHPFTDSGWTLAHNGVVEPVKNTKRKSCDSMYIVESMARAGGPGKLHCDVAGYAAIVGTTPNGEPFALRDSRAPLCISWVPTWEAFVLSSGPEYTKDIVGSLEHTRPVSLLPWVYHVWTGEGWATSEVKPWAFSRPSPAAQPSKRGGGRGSRMLSELEEAADKALGSNHPFPDYDKEAQKWGKY